MYINNLISVPTKNTFNIFQVRDGNNADSPLLGRFCGSTLPETLTSSGSYMWIRFRSDSSATGDGFMAYYRSVSDGRLLILDDIIVPFINRVQYPILNYILLVKSLVH